MAPKYRPPTPPVRSEEWDALVSERRAALKERDRKYRKRTLKERQRVPFDLDDPEEEILRAVIGRRIIWVNTLTDAFEESKIPSDPDQRRLRVYYEKNGRRLLEWYSSNGGSRIVALEAITRVAKR